MAVSWAKSCKEGARERVATEALSLGVGRTRRLRECVRLLSSLSSHVVLVLDGLSTLFCKSARFPPTPQEENPGVPSSLQRTQVARKTAVSVCLFVYLCKQVFCLRAPRELITAEEGSCCAGENDGRRAEADPLFVINYHSSRRASHPRGVAALSQHAALDLHRQVRRRNFASPFLPHNSSVACLSAARPLLFAAS